jgi:hypothetical protein
MKKGRESVMSKKLQHKLMQSTKTSGNQLASIILLKESEHYEQMVQLMHRDLRTAHQQLSQGFPLPTPEILENVIHITKGRPTPSWKAVLASADAHH